MMRFTTKLLPSRTGNLGILQLNHPKALNALTLDMVHCFQDVLAAWHANDSALQAILLVSPEPDPSSKRAAAFCAGGDVKTVYHSGMTTSDQQHGKGLPGLPTAEFFRQEYIVNYKLATAPDHVPQISIWNGIVMGGGVGVSIHGKYRVATEHTVLAMPETAIGLFPDVGSMYWMPRLLPGGLAPYVALTGIRLTPPDLLYTGLATHYIPSNRLPDLRDALLQATRNNNATDNDDDSDDEEEENVSTPNPEKPVIASPPRMDVVGPVLQSFHETPPMAESSFLEKHRTMIDMAFDNANRVEDIITKLKELDNNDTSFGRDTLATLNKMSPTSLKVTLEGLKRGAQMATIGDDLQMEFRMSQAFMRPHSDFYRGVRAVLIDKNTTTTPPWTPSTLEEVSDAMVEEYFAPLGENEWKIPTTIRTSML